MGNLDLGRKWFDKAIDNGADMDNIDSELRSIFIGTKGKERAELKKHLLKIDYDRYGWVNKY